MSSSKKNTNYRINKQFLKRFLNSKSLKKSGFDNSIKFVQSNVHTNYFLIV